MKVLLIDHEILLLRSLSSHLRTAGHEVIEARDGREAVQRCPGRIDAMVSDLELPDTDGGTLLRCLRNMADVPIAIAIGGDDSVRVLEACRSAGFQHHLAKPVLRADLLALVEGSDRR